MTALVTGASRGIGESIALELAALGFDMALVGRNAAALEKVKAKMQGVKVCCIETDLSQIESIPGIVEEAVSALGGLDVLVNCAGLPQQGPFTEVTPEEWDRVFSVNARAPFFLCQAALPHLKRSSRPTVMQVFAKEVQPFGIRVHLISPGGVATEMVKKMRPDLSAAELIQPEEIAEIVRFLVTRKGTGTIDEFYIRRYGGLAFD